MKVFSSGVFENLNPIMHFSDSLFAKTKNIVYQDYDFLHCERVNLKKRDYIRIMFALLVNYHYVSLNAQSIIDICMQICLTDCGTDCNIEISHNLPSYIIINMRFLTLHNSKTIETSHTAS